MASKGVPLEIFVESTGADLYSPPPVRKKPYFSPGAASFERGSIAPHLARISSNSFSSFSLKNSHGMRVLR